MVVTEIATSMIICFIVLALWSLIWKGIALWKCGRRNQLGWFIAILLFNTAGILPIIYLILYRKKKNK